MRCRRPRQAEGRAEILVVGIHGVRDQKLGGVESGEGWIPQRVGIRPEVLVAQAQRKRERGSCLPAVLEKVGLIEMVRVESRCAKNPRDFCGWAAEVIQEVGE